MASCITSQWSGSTTPQVRLTVTIGSQTGNSGILSWTLEYVAHGYAAETSTARSYTVAIGGVTVKTGTYDINGKTGTSTIAAGTYSIAKTASARNISFSVSFAFNLTWSGVYGGTKSASGSITVPAYTTYTISYNANGVLCYDIPASQTKVYGTHLTLSSTTPYSYNHTFLGWGTSSTATTATYQPGDTYTTNASAVMYALWKANTYVVSYNANGGTNAPSSQTKTYGVALTLSTQVPTRTGYNFMGWGVSSSATIAMYQPGASYTNNAPLTLYAIWEVAYIAPIVINVSVKRCNSSGDTVSDSGSEVPEDYTYALVSFEWECFYDVSSITIAWRTSGSDLGSKTVSASGTSGAVSEIVGDGAFDPSLTYEIVITVADSEDEFTHLDTLVGTAFVIDFRSGGKGIAFGKAAELDDTAEFAWSAKFNEPVYGNVTGLNKLPEIEAGDDLNNYMQTGCWAIYTNANAESVSNVPTARAGRLEVYSSTGEGVNPEEWTYLRQKYTTYKVEYGVWERDITRNSTNEWTYGDWCRSTLSPAASTKAYHEQKILWEGVYYMNANQIILLSEAVSAQANGVVLVFSGYDTDERAALDSNFCSFFVPKIFVTSYSGYNNVFTMTDGTFSLACSKQLDVGDTYIRGYASNAMFGTGTNGITYANNKYVLRYVYGV